MVDILLVFNSLAFFFLSWLFYIADVDKDEEALYEWRYLFVMGALNVAALFS